MNTTCTRRLEIDAGHRLLNHEGKCRNYHGHRYKFDITCRAKQLDAVGRVVDFSVVKRLVGTWLDESLDHGMILQAGDPLIPVLDQAGSRIHIVSFSPTAENLAAYVFRRAVDLFKVSAPDVEVMRVRCWETPNCYADFSAPARVGPVGIVRESVGRPPEDLNWDGDCG